jgi:predicted Fe-S protein YdhL (DUF1289 family)
MRTVSTISTPCVGVCVMDRIAGLCRGCGRSLDEIARWGRMSESERQAVMASLPGRPGATARPAQPKQQGARCPD